MTGASGNRWSGMFSGLVEWWCNLRATRARLDELQNCGDDIGHIARDVDQSRSHFYPIAAKRPGAADRPRERLEALHIGMAL